MARKRRIRYMAYKAEQTIDQFQQVSSEILDKAQRVFQIVVETLKPALDVTTPLVQQAGQEALNAAQLIKKEDK